jgi:hypothetical protein
VRSPARGTDAPGAACSQGISLFVEDLRLISRQNSMIVGRAAALPGQPRQNGHPDGLNDLG